MAKAAIKGPRSREGLDNPGQAPGKAEKNAISFLNCLGMFGEQEEDTAFASVARGREEDSRRTSLARGQQEDTWRTTGGQPGKHKRTKTSNIKI